MSNMTREEYFAFQEKTIAKAEGIYEKAMAYCPLVFEPGKYEAYLAFMAKWIHFSMPNSLLLFMQKPDATYVCSFSKWQEMAKQQGFDSTHTILPESERKKGIALLLPFSFNRDEKRFLTYKDILVFDVSQVNNIKTPKVFKPATNFGTLDFSMQLAICRNQFTGDRNIYIGLNDDPKLSFQNAYTKGSTIYVNPYDQSPRTIASILEEIIRYMAEDLDIHKDNRVDVCQSVLYALISYTNLSVDLPKFPNISEYRGKEPEELFLHLHNICHIIGTIIYKLQEGYEHLKVELSDNPEVSKIIKKYNL